MDERDRDAMKRHASEHAITVIEDGDVVGLGTGSTAEHAIRLLGQEVEAGLDIVGVPTSFQARQVAIDEGIDLTTLDEVDALDIAIDGADQFAGSDLVKGGGAAHAREKVVDAAAERLVIVADSTKQSDVLDEPVPLEVLPDARTAVARSVRELGGEPTLRSAVRKSGPVVTDNGNLVFDCDFGEITDPAALGRDLASLPGVVEHGLFPGFADEIYVGTADGVVVIEP